MKLRVELIGWYGFRATGDDLIRWSLVRLLTRAATRLGIDIEFTQSGDCDLAIMGGGTIIGCDSAGICEPLERVSAPIAVLGPGFRNMGPAQIERWRPRMAAIFDRALAVGVRGPLTVRQLAENGMCTRAEAIGDPAIEFEPLARSVQRPLQATGRRFGVCIRQMAQEDQEERYASSAETYRVFAELVPRLAERYAAEPVFLSFCENDYDSDAAGAERLRALLPARYRDAALLPYCEDVRRNASELGGFVHLLSERMHPAILSWLQGRPCIGLDYQYRKAEDFMLGLELPDYCLRTDAFTPERYLAVLDDLEAQRTALVEHAAKIFADQRARQEDLAARVLAEACERKEA